VATLTIQESDVYGNLLGTQLVDIPTYWKIRPLTATGFIPTPSGIGFVNPETPASGGGARSAPSNGATAMLLLTPSPGAQAIVTFGSSPTPKADGIVITAPISMPPMGACLAVL
jgi:hypothetical protein